MCSKTAKPARRTQGSKWCRRSKRLAIYIRDGMSCVYCGRSIDDPEGCLLTLDHIIPYDQHGSNDPSNLLTCCHTCNSSRGNRGLEEFVVAVAQYINHGVTAEDILRHIADCLARPLDRKAAQELINRRGSWAAALKG